MMAPGSQGARRVVVAARDFSLRATLESAQLFRVRAFEDGYVVHSGAERFVVRQRGDSIESLGSAGVGERFLKRFFALDESFDEPAERLRACPELAEAIRACRGIRIMRQDPWECLVGFLCSSCCNVPRIKRMTQAICDAAGAEAGDSGEWRAFPEPGELPSEQALRALGVGFRAAHLSRVNRPEMRAWLDGLRSQEFSASRGALLSLAGVGEKIADCVLLYSLGFGQAFPVDVWVRRAVREVFFNGRAVSDRDIQRFAAERFGPDAGYAQLFLFHWRRTVVG